MDSNNRNINKNKNSIKNIFQLRKNNPSNPLIGYLNINSLRNKIIDIESFPNSQFLIENFEIRKRKDRNKNGGGLIEYVSKGLICKEINEISKSINNEIICSEITIRNKKWLIFNVYRPPYHNNLNDFFEELENLLTNAFSK